MRIPGYQCLIGAFFVHSCLAQTVLDLGGPGWTLNSTKLNLTVAATIPSQVHLDLFAAGAIPEPYYGTNEVSLRYLAENEWTYTKNNIAGLSKSGNLSTYLVFQGLDTFADIKFCGKYVASVNNQFRQWIFDVSTILKNCTESPTLQLDFASAPKTILRLSENNATKCAFCFGTLFEFPDREYMRKEQSDFGWDFAPAFSPSGIWLPVYAVQLAGEDEVYVRNSIVDVYRQGQVNNLPPDQSQPWAIDAAIDYLGSLPPSSQMRATIVDEANNPLTTSLLSNVNVTEGSISGSFMLKKAPKLWWPNGYGNQSLYNLTVEILGQNDQVLTTVKKRIGFRTIVLNQQTISADQLSKGIAPGNNWDFQINGRDIYCKGSNLAPIDTFWPRVDEQQARILFDSAIVSHQVMFRVWGGGVYLPDFIYDIADELGIMMWSEFIFSDSQYPVDKAFLANVYEETTYQVRRLNHHASLAAWVGNNEIELILSSVLAYLQANSPSEVQPVLEQYEVIFENLLVNVVFHNARSVSYSPSSVTKGYLSFNYSSPMPITERFYAANGSIDADTDYYNYSAAVAFSDASYPIGRFADEFGFQSMPSLQSWQEVLPPSQLSFNSTMVLSRNHHWAPVASDPFYTSITNYTAASLSGMGEMSQAVTLYYPTPAALDFAGWCYATQVFHAEMLRSEIAFYRRGVGMPERNLGCLYWSLNDICGRWKVAQYGVKDIYQPVIIAPFNDGANGSINIYGISDLWNTTTGTASLTCYDWSGAPLNVSSTLPTITIGALNITHLFTFNPSALPFNTTNAVAKLSISVSGVAPNTHLTQTYTHTNWYTPVPLSHAGILNPHLTLSHNTHTGLFTITASAAAAWVWLTYPDGVTGNFEDNGFWMLPETREVGFTVRSDTTGGAWVKGVTVESIWDLTGS